jgi:hypothetical protein
MFPFFFQCIYATTEVTYRFGEREWLQFLPAVIVKKNQGHDLQINGTKVTLSLSYPKQKEAFVGDKNALFGFGNRAF